MCCSTNLVCFKAFIILLWHRVCIDGAVWCTKFFLWEYCVWSVCSLPSSAVPLFVNIIHNISHTSQECNVLILEMPQKTWNMSPVNLFCTVWGNYDIYVTTSPESPQQQLKDWNKYFPLYCLIIWKQQTCMSCLMCHCSHCSHLRLLCLMKQTENCSNRLLCSAA